MMDPLVIAILLLVAALALLVAEVILPSHGLISVMAAATLVASVVYAFLAGPWIGVGFLATMVVASPFVFMWMMEMWPRTPVGKRLVLNATSPNPEKLKGVPLHAKGRTVTELRPMGECDFGAHRCEVISEYGMIAAGREVVVVAFDGEGKPIVKGS